MNGSKIPKAKLDHILEAIRLAPSSMGLQPFQIMVVGDQAIREQIFAESCKQPQIRECSHLLIFNGWNTLTENQVDEYMENIANERQHDLSELMDFKTSILGALGHKSKSEIQSWSAMQIYIALGTAIDAAAMSEVDATPMEGFDKKAMDKLFDLEAKGLHSVVLLALGYRNEDEDFLAKVAKVRRKPEDIFEFI
ncbi:NAD(P)H-dependent oxidoreductase [Membranihabitans marinus]